mmetsp:Transcript_34521/g.75554  ORF Transcript_34521/g.75554 Transcript_34521/m.75554 type:complete len:584 (-) Transcript_34521:49-1800(-)
MMTSMPSIVRALLLFCFTFTVGVSRNVDHAASPSKAALIPVEDHAEVSTRNNRHDRILQASTVPQFDYFERPDVKFVKQLPNTGTTSQPGIRRSNAVQLSPDEARLYVTLTDGAFYSMDRTTGRIVATYKPKPRQSDWSVESGSGIDFYMGDGDVKEKYMVYSIADVSPQGEKQSRVIALSHPSAKLMWTSPPMLGEVSGTPVITSSGTHIFLTRNTEDNTAGHFTILDATDQGMHVFDEASDRYREEDRAPYGPVGLARNPVKGASWDKSGIINRNDVAWWAHSTDAGRTDDGMTRGYQLPKYFDGVTFPRVIRLKPVTWTTTNAPVFSSDGDDVYFTGTRSGVRAWVNHADGNEKASWSASLTRKNNDGLQPIYSSVALEPGEGNQYVGSATSTFAKISKTGIIPWEVPIGSVALGQAKVSYDNERVYFIETNEGTVAAHETRLGQRLWSMSCREYLSGDNCQSHTVEGEFSLSRNGQFLYFGNRVGQVIALQLGDAPTDPPSPAPTPREGALFNPMPTELVTDEPTFSPIPFPTMEPEGTISPWPTWDTAEPTVKSSALRLCGACVFAALTTASSIILIL